MNGTDELREYTEKQVKWMDVSKVHYRKLLAIADRIDAEHERAEQDLIDANNQMEQLCECSVELPKDADGEYIHVGDVLNPPAGCEDYVPMLVMRLTYDGYENEWFFDGEAGGFCGMVGKHMDVAGWTHHHAPTVEDVLREFAESYLDYEGIPSAGRRGVSEALMDEYASKLRLAEGEDV